MNQPSKSRFHFLLGKQKARIQYKNRDFLDYLILLAVSFLAFQFIFGSERAIPSWVQVASQGILYLGQGLLVFLAISFIIRHGVRINVPYLLKRPQDLVFSLVHKVMNIRYPWILAVLLLTAENLLILGTPDWPHYTQYMKQGAFALFFTHLGVVTIYRSIIGIHHCIHHKHVRQVLQETNYKRFVPTPGLTIHEIVHGYVTGLVTHLMTLAPWFLIISLFDFSLVLMPATVILGFIIESRFMMKMNEWFYRDHWLGHHSEFDFLYLHGNHHDALPSGVMAVSGNGMLEGLLRYGVGFPHAYYNPLVAFFFQTFTVMSDINSHQYIPGLFPKLPTSDEMRIHGHHAVHHFGWLEPYGLGAHLPEDPNQEKTAPKQESKYVEILANSIRLDEQLNGYNRDNPVFKKYLKLVDKYHTRQDSYEAHGETYQES